MSLAKRLRALDVGWALAGRSTSDINRKSSSSLWFCSGMVMQFPSVDDSLIVAFAGDCCSLVMVQSMALHFMASGGVLLYGMWALLTELVDSY